MKNLTLRPSEEYLNRKALYEQFGYDIEAERSTIVDKADPLGKKILEIGSGKGYLTITLAQKGYHFMSIDISAQEQQFAKENIAGLGLSSAVDFQIADAHAMPFVDREFDTIFCVNSFHHIKNQFSFLREIIRIAGRSSKIIISDFNKKGFALIGDVHQSEGREHKFFSVCWESIVDFLGENGFQTEFSDTKYQKILLARRPKKDHA